jgi:hypothetical protein
MTDKQRKQIIKALVDYEASCDFDGIWTIAVIDKIIDVFVEILKKI